MQTEGVLQLPQSAIFAKTCTVHDKSRMLIVSVERNSRYGKAQDSAPNLRCHDISDLDPEDGLSQCRRSEEHTSELQSLMRISYAVFCLKKKKDTNKTQKIQQTHQQS